MNTCNLFDLSGKIALVTGSSRGIGASIAKTLAAYGAHVIVSSRKLEACETVAAEIRADGGRAEARSCHIGEMEQLEKLFSDIDATHGRLDILVNNAAVNPYFGPIFDTEPSVFQKSVDVNIRGYFYSSIHGAKLMAKGGGGSIINVASINAVAPGENQGIYSITKAAVVSMTLAFAKECSTSSIRVNALLPGPTDTKFTSSLVHNEAAMTKLRPRLTMGRVGRPDEMAGAVLYLASDAASYTTGACLAVDGGFLLT